MTAAEFRVYIQRRLEAGESYKAIGDAFGVSKQAVQQWMSGKNEPSNMALKMAETIRAA